MGEANETTSIDAIRRWLTHASPHVRALGCEIVELSKAGCTLRMPYSEQLVGDPRTGLLHGGVLTTLLDSASGAAVLARLRKPVPIATLDLRIDYLRRATPRVEIHARVECFKVTHHVAFVRGTAFHSDPQDPVAAATGTFMLDTAAQRTEKP